MKSSRIGLAVGALLASLHVFSCICIFGFYCLSKDPQAALIFTFLVPLDPWLPLLSHSVQSEVAFMAITVLVGTVQWFVLGWVAINGGIMLTEWKRARAANLR